MTDLDSQRLCPRSLEDVNLWDRATWADPFETYRFLRDQAPIWFDETSQAFVVTRYEDIRGIISDPETFSVEFKAWGGTEWEPPPTLNHRDDPNHRAVRRVFERGFSPRALKDLEPYITDMANRLIDSFIGAGECDWVTEFAEPLPFAVICKHMGGIAEEDLAVIKTGVDAWITRLNNGNLLSPEEAARCGEAEAKMHELFEPVFAHVRQNPDDTLLSHLVNTEIELWGRPMNQEELHAAMIVDTFIGGAETAGNVLAAGARILATEPIVWKALKEDPEARLPGFVEEILRLEGPVHNHFRRATRDVEIGGVAIPTDAMINIKYGAANRDERHFPDPDTFDMSRPGRAHLAFGYGIHTCLGAPLARRELLLGFQALVDRVEDIALKNPAAPPVFKSGFTLRGLQHLPIRFTPSPVSS